jgi:hypothetical protein
MMTDTLMPYQGPGQLRCRPDEEIEAIRRETSWQQVEAAPLLTDDECAAIGRGEQACPHCHGHRYVRVAARGVTTGAVITGWLEVSCPCAESARFWLHWRSVPTRFRDVSFDTLVPQTARQKKIWETMREHPDDSYYLVGAPGTGKTHLSYALYQRAVLSAVRRDPHFGFFPYVWRVTVSVLLDQHVADATDPEAPSPVVTERKVAYAVEKGFRPVLFLDEIDKFPASEFKLGRLGQIVDAIYMAKGQIVATANENVEGLTKRWGANVAGTILRRIGSDGGHTLNFSV